MFNTLFFGGLMISVRSLIQRSGYGTIDATHIVEVKEKVDGSNAHQLQECSIKDVNQSCKTYIITKY